MKRKTNLHSCLWITVILLSLLSLNGTAAQTVCGNQFEPVARACTTDLIEGNTIYYDSALFRRDDCVCDFNTTSSAIQVSAFVQPPLDLCGSKIEISVGPDNPFMGQRESVTCGTENVVLDTTLHNSGTINIQNVGSETLDLNSEFCLQFEADVGDLVTINCKPNIAVSTEQPTLVTTANMADTPLSTTTTQEALLEEFVPETTVTNITGFNEGVPEAAVTKVTEVNEGLFEGAITNFTEFNEGHSEMAVTNVTEVNEGISEGVSEIAVPSQTMEERMKELTTLFPGAFQSTTDTPLIIEPFIDADFLNNLAMEEGASSKTSENIASSDINPSTSTDIQESTTSVIDASSSTPTVDEVQQSSTVQHSSMTTDSSVLSSTSQLSSSITEESKSTSLSPSLVMSESTISAMAIDSDVSIITDSPIQPSESVQVVTTESFQESSTASSSLSSIQSSISLSSVTDPQLVPSDITLSSSVNAPVSQPIESSYSVSGSFSSIQEIRATALSLFSESMISNTISSSVSSSYETLQEMSSLKFSSSMTSDGIMFSGVVDIYPDDISTSIKNIVSTTEVSELPMASMSTTNVADKLSTMAPPMSSKTLEDETSMIAFLSKNSKLESKTFNHDGIESSSIDGNNLMSSSSDQIESLTQSTRSISFPVNEDMFEDRLSFPALMESPMESSSTPDALILNPTSSIDVQPTKTQFDVMSSVIPEDLQSLNESVVISGPGFEEPFSTSSNLFASSATNLDASSSMFEFETSLDSSLPTTNIDSAAVTQLLSSEPVEIFSSNSEFSSYQSLTSQSVLPPESSIFLPDEIQSSVYFSQDFITESTSISAEQVSTISTSEIMPSSSEVYSSISPSQTLAEIYESSLSLIDLDPFMDLVGNLKDDIISTEKSTVTTMVTEASTTATTTEITTATSATQTTDSEPAATDHSKIRFIEDTTFPTGLDSIFTTDKKTEQSTSSDVFGMPSFPPDLNMFTDSMDPFSFDTSNAPTITDVVPNLSESTTSGAPQKEKTTERVLSEVKSDTTVRTTMPTPPPIVPADDTALETSGQFVPVSVIENVHNDGRIDVGHDTHDKTHNGDGHHDINYFNKTQGEDTEQLDKDTITVIVIGSIIGVVIFIAIIVILVTFLKARKGSGDLPDVNEKDLEMNGSTKGIDNPLIQLEQETNASFPPPNAEDTSGKPNGHASSEPSSSAVKEDMNSTIDSIEIAQNDSISDTGGKSVSL